MTKLLFISSLLALAACSPNVPKVHETADFNNQTSIVGGQDVTNQSFAQHVVAIHNVDLGYWCTGTLISNDTILTAAHCVNSGSRASYAVYFSHAPHPFDRTSRDVLEMRANSQYDQNAYDDRNDIGLVRFKGDLPPGFAPAALPTADDLAKMNKNFYAVGYGSITARKDSLGKGSGILRYTQLSLTNNVTTKQSQFVIDQSKGHGICFGDSGGPALTQLGGRDVVFGVASAVYTLDKNAKAQPDFDVCRYNAIYTSVFYQLSWITKTSADIH